MEAVTIDFKSNIASISGSENFDIFTRFIPPVPFGEA